MKKVITLIALFVCIVQARGQELEFGIKAGINTGTGTLAEVKNGANVVSTTKENLLGYNGGVYGRFKIMVVGIYIQPELVLNQRVGVFNFNDNGSTFQVTNKATYLDVPVLLGMKFIKLFRVYAGPNFQFLVSQSTDYPSTSAGLKKIDMNNHTTGLQVGAGLDIWKLRADVKWDWNPGSMGSFIQYYGSTPAFTNSMITIQLGYKLWGIL